MIKNIAFSLFTLIFLLIGSAVYAQDDVTEPNRLEHFLDNLETFSAGFEQILSNEFGEEIETSVGVVYLMTPGKFHWAYYEPYSQFIISNGITLWIYDEDLEQVTIRRMSDSIENSPAAVLGGDIDIDAHYVVIDLEAKDGINWLELTPRDNDSQYDSIRLGFNNENLAEMILFDNLGQETRIRFLDAKRNLTLDHSLFVFDPPEGVDVIDDRQ